MNPKDLPQFDNAGQGEIYRLLKIGAFADLAGASTTDHTSDHTAQTQIDPEQNESALIGAIISEGWLTIAPYRGILVYPLVFGVSFFIFYTTMNFPSLIASAQGFFSKPQNQQLAGEDQVAYNNWIKGYFYSVNNKDLLSPNNDYDKDGLTNYDEFILRTNPTVTDSDSDGTSDGVEVLNSSNPWGAGNLTASQNRLKDKINLNMVSERISYNVSSNKGDAVASNLDAQNFDLNRAGVLSIPKLKIQAPLIWSSDPSAFDADLEHGVIHYPGTALPGAVGTMYVSGHSSDYIWKHDKFATIFTKINYLTAGDDVYITVYGKDGKVYNYRYRVTGQKVYSPDDQTQFIDNSTAQLNLSTCWPIGTAKDRMVITAQLSSL
jgi:LPXTG-site transpeptidase (sortase) family protein